MFAIVLVPVAIGMSVRTRSELFAKKLERPIRLVSAAVLALVILVSRRHPAGAGDPGRPNVG